MRGLPVGTWSSSSEVGQLAAVGCDCDRAAVGQDHLSLTPGDPFIYAPTKFGPIETLPKFLRSLNIGDDSFTFCLKLMSLMRDFRVEMIRWYHSSSSLFHIIPVEPYILRLPIAFFDQW